MLSSDQQEEDLFNPLETFVLYYKYKHFLSQVMNEIEPIQENTYLIPPPST